MSVFKITGQRPDKGAGFGTSAQSALASGQLSTSVRFTPTGESDPRETNAIPLIQAPTLVLCGTDDFSSYPRMIPLAQSIKGSTVVELKGGMVPLPDQMPQEFAAAVMAFLG